MTPLTDVVVRNAKPGKKTMRLYDSGGLYLEVSPSGGKWWRIKYRFNGKENRLSLGVYPDVPLAGRKDKTTGEWITGARDKRDRIRQLLADGIDPGQHRKAAKAAKADQATNSFEAVAREWFKKHSPGWAESHSEKIIKRLENDLFPWIGGKPISEISAPEVLKALHRIEGRGARDTAHRALQNCGQVFRYGVATGRVLSDPCRDLRGALGPLTHEHFAAITEPKAVAALLRAIDGFQGTFVVQSALRLAPMFLVRPGELRKAEWTGFDLDKAEWRYLVTKTKTEHLVPLASQAVVILRDLHALAGQRRYVFPGRDPQKPMSDAALNAAFVKRQHNLRLRRHPDLRGNGLRVLILASAFATGGRDVQTQPGGPDDDTNARQQAGFALRDRPSAWHNGRCGALPD